MKKNEKLSAGDTLELTLPEVREVPIEAQPIPLEVCYEDADVIVVNKPKGLVVHPAPGHADGTLVNALLYALDSLSGIGGVLRPGIVHRIDKDTSGLLVVAKNDRAHASLAKQIAEKSCHRIYFALLEGSVKADSGRIVTEIGRSPSDRLKMAVLPEGKGKTAITDYEVEARYGGEYTLCRFTLQTGRTHQIRVHAKYMGNPVVGDPLYGIRRQKFKLNGQLLHAYKLILTHPSTGERMEFTAPLPGYFQEILHKLGRQYDVGIKMEERR